MEVADWVCYEFRQTLLVSSEGDTLFRSFSARFGDNRLLFYCPSDYDWPENLLTVFQQDRMGKFFSRYLDFAETRSDLFAYNDNLLLKPAIQQSFRRLHKTTDPEECKAIVALADNFLNNKEFYRLTDVNQLLSDVLQLKKYVCYLKKDISQQNDEMCNL